MRRLTLCTLALLLAGGLLPAPAAAQFPENPWPDRRVLNIAHRGGAFEVPENTLYGYERALELGSDMLEMDVFATSDGHIVVMHDATVDRTTNGGGRIDSFTLEEIKGLDAAHWFVDDRGATRNAEEHEYVYRGIATGDFSPPEGYEANDFRVPTLREVLERFPDVLLNIEIKSGAPETLPYHQQVADLLEEFDRVDDVIVASFVDTHLEAFKVAAPEVSTATATGQAAVFWASARGPLPGAPNPRYQALQMPVEFLGIEVIDPDGEFVAKAQANGFAVHVWTINDRDTMEWLLDLGVDGIMTDRPSLLTDILAERGL